MSIEMDNPKTIQEKLDAASNLVAQIGLALRIGDIGHAMKAQDRALALIMQVNIEMAVGECDEETEF